MLLMLIKLNLSKKLIRYWHIYAKVKQHKKSYNKQQRVV